ncbi:MAG: hypothetical protein ACOYL3_17865 [Desulfuromonadaceae bacterium]
MRMSYSSLYLGFTGLLLAVVCGFGAHSRCAVAASVPALERMSHQVKSLELTDLCLFSEASYTRNLAMTDRFTPFQDSPLTFEHFPTGAVAGPPAHLIRP